MVEYSRMAIQQNNLVQDPLKEIELITNKILASDSPKKLIVAGPGTGKTTFFRKIIVSKKGTKDNFLVFTFINTLEAELEKDLGDIAKIHTFHGYCHFLLRRFSDLRGGLISDFEYYPPLIELTKSDSRILNSDDECPEFVKEMRNLTELNLDFYLDRSNYYNAVGFDDSVYRVFKAANGGVDLKDKYKLVVVDEYQDFNLLETKLLGKLSETNSVLLAGDDDQALYCDLRGSNPTYIRNLWGNSDYEKFELPLCFRSTKAIVMFFNNFLDIVKAKGYLKGRIDKRFLPSPTKESDDSDYPKIKLVITSIQKKAVDTNYFGRYILRELEKVKPDEISESHTKGFPTVLIIGASHYLDNLSYFLHENNIDFERRKSESGIDIKIEDGLKLLKIDKNTNLAWRIILECTKPSFFKEILSKTQSGDIDLVKVIPSEFVNKYLDLASKLEIKEESKTQAETDKSKPSIKLTTFEGAKGLSAHRVFIAGLQNGILPKDSNRIRDIEISKLLVALTRARKQCHILSTYRFAGVSTQPSKFIDWVVKEKVPEIEIVNIDKTYWK